MHEEAEVDTVYTRVTSGFWFHGMVMVAFLGIVIAMFQVDGAALYAKLGIGAFQGVSLYMGVTLMVYGASLLIEPFLRSQHSKPYSTHGFLCVFAFYFGFHLSSLPFISDIASSKAGSPMYFSLLVGIGLVIQSIINARFSNKAPPHSNADIAC